jgi:hypothetical protein
MAPMKRLITSLFLLFGFTIAFSQQMNWMELAEDTVYYANEYLPDDVMVTAPGPGQVWDFRSLRAPYAISRRIVMTGERNRVTYGNLINGKQTEAILQLSGNSAQVVQVIEENPICPNNRLVFSLSPAFKPFFNGELGDEYNYKGRMQSVFAWPRDMVCIWAPTQLPDSCRITYNITSETVVDGEGTLYLPTEVTLVYRQHIKEKRTVKIETKRAGFWYDVTSLVPVIKPISFKEILRFVDADSGLEWADIEVRDNLQPMRVEFKTYPLVTRIISDEPTRPDVFASPNPSFDIVRFQMNYLLYGKYKLKIFNILGVPVKEIELEVDDPKETISIDLGDLQRGTYLYRLQDGFGRTIRTKRIVLIQA